MKSVETHEFAFYTNAIRTLHKESRLDIFQLVDPEVVHRIAIVLRLQKGDKLVLFDNVHHVHATIRALDAKKTIMLELHAIEVNKKIQPPIHWLLPLLKREAFEEALYTLTELGATSIQPILTQKTTRFWAGEKELLRSQKIIIAAAEQAKQFILPILEPILPLELWLMKGQSPLTVKIFFDPTGIPLRETIASTLTLLEQHNYHDIIAFAGPEGDLTHEEKMILADQGFTFCALTPTILRAQQAIAVGLGSLRSLLRKSPHHE